jgi:predicted porin
MVRSLMKSITLSLLLVALTPLAVLARGEEVQTQGGTGSLLLDEGQSSWSELSREVEARLESMQPRLDSLESLKRPLNKEERAELAGAYEELQPLVQELRERRDEASEAQLQAAQPARDIYTRIEVLLEETQTFAAPEEARNAPKIETMISHFAVYGSLRGRAFLNEEGETTLDDSTSRVGLRGQLNVSKTYEFFARGEIGTNLVGDVTRFLIGGDPGTEGGSENVAIPLRLAFVGFDGPEGRVSFGKQWSTYYDVAVFTDQAPFFGGAASGTYAAGTDGGVSGTGRADQALQYRFAISHFKFGLQAQIRNETDNDQSVADTWGISTNYQFDEGITLGAAFNQVRDGVLDPEPEQPKLGDQALILGARWQNETSYCAATYTDFENHEKDDQQRFFSGHGWEVFADYEFGNGIGVGGTYNYQKPESDHPGQYKLDFLSVGASYFLGKSWRFYLLYKFDNSRTSDGSDLGQDTLGAAVFYNFSWGFAPF